MDANLEKLQEMFGRMAKDLNIESPLKWGFFFVDSKKSNLLKIKAELAPHGYTLEEMHQDDAGRWWLQMSKTEVLTCEKLHRRNVSFNELALHYGVLDYDGWDVGPAGG